MYGFRAKAVTPSNKPGGIAIANPKRILNQYGFMYGNIRDKSQEYLNEFCAAVADNLYLFNCLNSFISLYIGVCSAYFHQRFA